MSKQKVRLQEVPALYWKMINGAGEETIKNSAKTPNSASPDCQLKVKTNNEQTVTASAQCSYPDGKIIEVSGGHNFRTGYSEGEILFRWQ